MESVKDLLLIGSFELDGLIEDYRIFIISLLPSLFIIAVLIEYLDRLEPFTLIKRAFISIFILVSVPLFYHQAIDYSMRSADEVLASQKQGNALLMDMMMGKIHLSALEKQNEQQKSYAKEKGIQRIFGFLKYHLFVGEVNDIFVTLVIFITKICFLILKVVYSLVYYLGYGLIGIPCLLYLFPTMGNVLRGAILSFIWCLIVPHILVFMLSLIGSEINKAYASGEIIGGTLTGTALLFVLSLFMAFTPLIASMLLSGSGTAQAGGVIAAMGANSVMNLPKNTINTFARGLTGDSLGPKTKLISMIAQRHFGPGDRIKNPLASPLASKDKSQSALYAQESAVEKKNNKFQLDQNTGGLSNETRKSVRSKKITSPKGAIANPSVQKHGTVDQRAKTPHVDHHHHRPNIASASHRHHFKSTPGQGSQRVQRP